MKFKKDNKKVNYKVCWEKLKAYFEVLEITNPATIRSKFSKVMDKLEKDNTKEEIDYELCWESYKAYLQILESINPNLPVIFSEAMVKIEKGYEKG